MSATHSIVIDSDEEPQPKKQKHDRSPLVVINGENGSKRKQLTLKDMVSPKPKQSTLSNFKVISKPAKSPSTASNKSPKEKTSTQPVNKSPMDKTSDKSDNKSPKGSVLVTSTSETTPVRGVKRKSNFSGDEKKETPVKQPKIPDASDKSRADDSPKSGNGGKSPKNGVTKPTLESMLIRSPKQQNSKKNVSAEDSKGKEGGKDPEIVEVKVSSDAEKTIPVKPVKKKFGDYKRKNLSKVKPDVVKVADDSKGKDIPTPTVSNKPSKPVKKVRSETDELDCEKPKSDEQKGVGTSKVVEKPAEKSEQKIDTSPPKPTGNGVEAKENVEPSPSNKSPKVHVDGEKPGPSGISKPVVKKQRPLTEKQKKLQEEREKKRQEVEKEKERKRLEREKEKEAREEAKRVEQAKKDAEKQAREKAREEVRLKKEEEKKQREEEKKQREEEKRQKEEEKDAEKRKKMLENEEEKRLKEEELEKKRQKQLKEQEKFKSFFVVKKPNVASVAPKVETLEKKFRDFVITPNMLLAPLTRTEPVTGDILPPGPLVWDDNMSHIRDVVKEMKSKQKYQTDQLSCDLEIICISKPNEIKVKRKTLQFHENHRPAYYGSWRKKSSFIRPRRPFGQDKTLLDYDYDSDEDWEEEEEGEDISSEKEDEKEEEKEKEKDEDDDEDDGFFVPHGYLSDDEGDEDCEMTDEAKKKRLERRKKQFEEEQQSKESGVLKAQIVGPAWQTDPSDSAPSDQAHYLSQFTAVWSSDVTDSEPLDPFSRVQPVAMMETDSAVKNDKKELPVSGYGMLIRFLHGNPLGMSRAVEAFQEMWHSDETRGKVSKRQLTQLIPLLMKKCMRPGNGMKLCWYASDEVLTKYELKDLIGLHCEAPEPPKPLPPPAVSLLKFTKTSSAERDLAQLRQQQSLLEALQQAVKQQKDAILQQQQNKTEPQNTLKSFMSSSPAPAKNLTPAPGNHGNTSVAGTNSGSTNGANQNPAAQPQQKAAPAPRRIALVPIKNISFEPINVEDSN